MVVEKIVEFRGTKRMKPCLKNHIFALLAVRQFRMYYGWYETSDNSQSHVL